MLKEPTQAASKDDHILQRAVDKSLNGIILACDDLSALLLRKKNRVIPNTYREIILTTHEFIGDAALKIAPLSPHAGMRRSTST